MKRTLAAALLVMGGLAAPSAEASHPTQFCLDVVQETTSAYSDDDVTETLVAYPGASDANHPPEHEGCVTELVEPGSGNWGGNVIDFEITGVADPDDSDSPNTPDMTCTVAEEAGSCTVSPPSTNEGQQTIRAWIDSDNNDTYPEADLAEGRDEVAQPGNTPEPDTTDVVIWNWSQRGCDDTGAQASCVEHATQITIDFRRRKGTFEGSVISPDYSPCQVGRIVKLFKRTRSGGKSLKATTQTDENGYWKTGGFSDSHGRYFAVTPRYDAVNGDPCLRARSETLRLP